jgi:hypothetical protein
MQTIAPDDRSSGADVGGVAGSGPVDGGGRTVDGHDPSSGEALAHQRHGHARAAAELEDAVVGAHVEELDGPRDAGRRLGGTAHRGKVPTRQ